MKINSKLNKIMFKIKSEYSKNLLYEKVNIVNIYQATIYIGPMKSSVYFIKKIQNDTRWFYAMLSIIVGILNNK